MVQVKPSVNKSKLNQMFKIFNNQASNYLQILMLRDQHNFKTRVSECAIILLHINHPGD